uniref:Uncharacterized protein LOC117367485 isoform X1 n=1 Tax=Geotrypetes seraphini TaxID=260995 RepID=A0A6P8SCP1_GEOSA|nr:uncharacterized protein LOC117367485 isoform X1 [Geotrypetes seraphini]
MVRTGRRQDWYFTSSGIGLNYRPPVTFPPPHIKSTIDEPLAPGLQRSKEVLAFDEVINHYETTTGTVHNRKYSGGVLSQPSYPIAPAHWKVHYNKDLWEKLSVRAWRPPLCPGNQCSEMKAQFIGQPALPALPAFHAGPQPFILENHHNKGPSQDMVPSTENKALNGSLYYICDQGVLNRNDIYASTTARDFRAFTKEELEGYPKKDILTYWQGEEYPKAWGHGLKENPLPKESLPTLRRPLPMRDTMQFPTATKLLRAPPLAAFLPNHGLKTLVQETFKQPLDAKRSHDINCPLDCPWTLPLSGPLPEIMSVPKMYETEYQTYGSNQPVTV